MRCVRIPVPEGFGSYGGTNVYIVYGLVRIEWSTKLMSKRDYSYSPLQNLVENRSLESKHKAEAQEAEAPCRGAQGVSPQNFLP